MIKLKRDNKKRMFNQRVYSVKKRFLNMYKAANAGHIGCSLSCAELLVFLKFNWMKEKDSFILSKGHAAAALYSVLAEDGALSKDDINTFYKDGTYLAAHPPVNKIKGIPFATGSLGHGLSISAGMAYGSKLKKDGRMFFCVTSDGELNEGSVWEAALFISHNKLNNVVWLIDRNNIQGFGRTEEVMDIEPLEEKLRAFGFFTFKADGHDYDSLEKAKTICQKEGHNRPKVVICKTIKGHGISFMENTVDWHYLPMNQPQFKKAMNDLEGNFKRAGKN